MDRLPDLATAVRLHAKRWQVKPDERVVILTSTETYPPTREAAVSAVVEAGADPVVVTLQVRGPLLGEMPAAAVDLLSAAELVVDLQHLTWAYTESQTRVRAALAERGGRLVALHGREEDVYHVLRCTPDPALIARTERAKAYVDGAKTIRVTSRLGTDLRVQRGNVRERPSFCPPGQAAFAPPDDGVDGVLYFVGGVRIQTPALRKQMIYEPVRMEIAEGKIREIHRDNGSAAMLDDWFRSHKHPNSFHFAHINLGLDPRVELSQLDNLSVHYNYGGILMGFGVNYTPLFGSTVRAPSHVELALVGGSYAVDDTLLLIDGEFTEASGLAVKR